MQAVCLAERPTKEIRNPPLPPPLHSFGFSRRIALSTAQRMNFCIFNRKADAKQNTTTQTTINMTVNTNCEIFSSRTLNAPLHIAYQAFANPAHLMKWWGPEGFTNTFHEFDLRPEGKWMLTMHGPEKGNYENSSIFKTIEPLRLISWRRLSPPLFEMEVGFEEISVSKTRITFRMIFTSAGECEKIRPFAEPKNEENFDRLERELPNVVI